MRPRDRGSGHVRRCSLPLTSASPSSSGHMSATAHGGFVIGGHGLHRSHGKLRSARPAAGPAPPATSARHTRLDAPVELVVVRELDALPGPRRDRHIVAQRRVSHESQWHVHHVGSEGPAVEVRVAERRWERTMCTPGTPQHPWRLPELPGDVMPLDPRAGRAAHALGATTSRYIPVDRSEPRSGRAADPRVQQGSRMAPSRCLPDPGRRRLSARQRIRVSDAKPPPGWCLVGARGFVALRPEPPGRATGSAAPSRSGLRTRRPSPPAGALPGPLR